MASERPIEEAVGALQAAGSSVTGRYTIWRCPDCGGQPGNRRQSQRCRDSGHRPPERVTVYTEAQVAAAEKPIREDERQRIGKALEVEAKRRADGDWTENDQGFLAAINFLDRLTPDHIEGEQAAPTPNELQVDPEFGIGEQAEDCERGGLVPRSGLITVAAHGGRVLTFRLHPGKEAETVELLRAAADQLEEARD